MHTQGEKLKVRLDMDGEQGGAEYEWGWTPVTGNLLYAMPEEGTTVKLCFGSEDALEGTVDVCVRENSAEMPQQQKRLLTTAAGKQLALYPGQIFMGGSGGQAGITDGNAVSLGSAKRLRMTAAGVVSIHARDIHAQTPLEINMYRSPSGCEVKQRDIAAIGTRSNPPTGMNPSCGRGDSGFTMNFEFNGLSKSGLLCGTDFIKYRPFTDEPEEGIADTKPGIDKAELNKNVIIGDAAVVAAAVTVSCVAAAGGAVAAPVVLGLMTIVCGYSLVHGQARSSFIYTPYAAEMAVAELVPAGISG